MKMIAKNKQDILALYSAIIAGEGVKTYFRKMDGAELSKYLSDFNFEAISLGGEFGKSYIFIKDDVYDSEFLPIDLVEEIVSDAIKRAKTELQKINSEIEVAFENKPQKKVELDRYYIYSSYSDIPCKEYKTLEALLEDAKSAIINIQKTLVENNVKNEARYIAIGGYYGDEACDIINNLKKEDESVSEHFHWCNDIFTLKLSFNDDTKKAFENLIDVVNN